MSLTADHPFYKSWTSHAGKYFKDNFEYKSRFNLFNNEQFKSLFRNAPAVVLVINHIENKYEFFSENIVNLAGYTADEFYKGKVPFGMSLIYPDHEPIFIDYIFPRIFAILEEHRQEGAMKDLRLTYNFKIRRKDGLYIWVQQQMSVLEEDDHGHPVLSLYFMHEITYIKKDEQIDFTVAKLSEDGYYRPILIMNYPSNVELQLSHREIEILSLLSLGKSSREIAEQLSISHHTVQTHRKNMLEKSGCKNTPELLKLAIVKGIA